eukprot:scpid88914/ scgid9625/ 
MGTSGASIRCRGRQLTGRAGVLAQKLLHVALICALVNIVVGNAGDQHQFRGMGVDEAHYIPESVLEIPNHECVDENECQLFLSTLVSGSRGYAKVQKSNASDQLVMDGQAWLRDRPSPYQLNTAKYRNCLGSTAYPFADFCSREIDWY